MESWVNTPAKYVIYNNLTKKIDVYIYGVMIFDIVNGKNPMDAVYIGAICGRNHSKIK